MNAEPDLSRPRVAGDAPASTTDDWLSALVDGELQAAELDELLSVLQEDAEGQATCLRYRLIGDLVRAADSVQGAAPHVFVSGVRARLQAEAALQPERAVLPRIAQPAANDAVFRWKLVAGIASVAAVMAVSWSLLGVAPGAAGPASGAQLAQLNPVRSSVTTDAQPVEALVVNTAQGPVIRDARLEELLAEHRQYGGMSALQMPAGFLRDATHQSAPQR